MKNLLPLLLLLSSCSKKNCENAIPHLMLSGFGSSELNLMKIEEFELGSGFSKIKRTFYLGESIINQSADSLKGIGLAMDLNSSYRITFISSGAVYNIHDITFKQSHYWHSYIGGEAKACTNAYSYWVNSVELTHALEYAPSGPRPFGVGIYVAKAK